MARLYVGLSGYSYKAWQGPSRFYPPGLKTADFLRYYATRFRTVELDGVWYRMPTEKTVHSWVSETPEEFSYAPKAHRQITHFLRLNRESLDVVAILLQRLTPLAQAGKLGPILLQLPPNMTRDDERLTAFLAGLPPNHRWAVEFRHDSWHAEQVEALLRRHGIAWASVETDERSAEHRDTASFVYARLRRSRYGDDDLQVWADRLRRAREAGKDCFVYCKHEDEGSPWIWADRLLELNGFR